VEGVGWKIAPEDKLRMVLSVLAGEMLAYRVQTLRVHHQDWIRRTSAHCSSCSALTRSTRSWPSADRYPTHVTLTSCSSTAAARKLVLVP
jgi:hypothetical protein